jgi:hypothetical protein
MLCNPESGGQKGKKPSASSAKKKGKERERERKREGEEEERGKEDERGKIVGHRAQTGEKRYKKCVNATVSTATNRGIQCVKRSSSC